MTRVLQNQCVYGILSLNLRIGVQLPNWSVRPATFTSDKFVERDAIFDSEKRES